MRLDRRLSASRRIRLTPLIDVVFILLVFFMLAADLQRWRVLDIDASAGSSGVGEATGMVLQLGSGCVLSIEGTAIDIDRLSTHLRGLAAREPISGTAIHVGSGVALQCLVTVMDRVRRAGAGPVSLTGAEML